MLSSNNKRAVALKYDESTDKSPVVIASGAGYCVDRVIHIAEENGVPIYQDDSLSMMLSQLEVGKEIPDALFETIVDIYVYFLNFNKDNK